MGIFSEWASPAARQQMRRHSPYNYAFNNPVFFIDPDGMSPVATLMNGGQLTGEDVQNSAFGNQNLGVTLGVVDVSNGGTTGNGDGGASPNVEGDGTATSSTNTNSNGNDSKDSSVNKKIDGVAGNLKFAPNQTDKFKKEVNQHIEKIATTEIGNMVLTTLIEKEGVIEISEVAEVLQSVTTAEASEDGNSLTGNGTIQVSLKNKNHDGALATGLTTLGHELWHAYQIKQGTEIYFALHSTMDKLNTRYSEIQAVGFENYLRAELNIYGGPRLHYSSRDNPLNSVHSVFSAPIKMYRKPGRFWGTNPWKTQDFSTKKEIWLNILKQ